jgi:nucleotide-binding universal stress UspA family protein
MHFTLSKEESAMSNRPAATGKRPFVLVLGVNLADQESSGHAFDQAIRIASRIPCSEMHVVHVLQPETTDEKAQEAAGLLKLYISEKIATLDISGPQGTGLHVRRGDAAREIAQMGVDLSADMIVVGTRGPLHLKNLFVGSTAERVMATATCPVFVAGPRPRPQPSHVIVIDGPCPDCVQQRAATAGRTWWCARHSERHHLRRHHIYSYSTHLPFAEHDSEVSAIGSD